MGKSFGIIFPKNFDLDESMKILAIKDELTITVGFCIFLKMKL
jgi:hypothetical protein